jgi:hypothetical protein
MKRDRQHPIDEEMLQKIRADYKSLHESLWVEWKLRVVWANNALIAHIKSDEPLSRGDRDHIAGLLRTYFRSPAYFAQLSDREPFKHLQIASAAILKNQLQDCGLTATEAEQEIAEELDIQVEALRKRFQREFASLRKSSKRTIKDD